MPSAPDRVELRQFQAQPDIQHQPDRRAVGGDAGLVAQQRPAGVLRGLHLQRADVGLAHLDFRAQHELALVGVHHRLVARLGGVQHAARAADRGDAEGAGQDRGVAGGAGLLDRHAGNARGCASRATRPDPGGGRAGWRRAGIGGAATSPSKRGEQPAGEILHVGEALAQVGVADAAHAVVQFAGDALHRGLGGNAAADHLGDPAQPAGIGGDQAVGFQHLARGRGVLAAAAVAARRRRSARPGRAASARPRRSGAPVRRRDSRRAGAAGRAAGRAARPGRWRCRWSAACRRTRAARWRRRPPARRRWRRWPAASRPAAWRRFPARRLPPRCSGAALRFCTASTPSVRPARRTGTASIEA